MAVVAPPRAAPPLAGGEAEALFEEARRRQRRRRTRIAVVALAALAAGIAVYSVFAVTARSSGAGAGAGGRAGAVPHTRLVVVLVDVSGSMRATDVAPTRLDAARRAIRLFLDRLSPGIQVALMTFSDDARVVAAPTSDRKALLAALQTLGPLSGTALGDGLTSAVDLTASTLARHGIGRSTDGPLQAAVVLVSDGAQNRGTATPAAAARAAKAKGVTIDGIALGTKTGSVSFGVGGNYSTTKVPVPPDPRDVRMVDEVTHGSTFIAPDAASLARAFTTLAAELSR